MVEKEKQPVDEKVVVEVSKDKMIGVLWFEPPENAGKTITLAQIKSEIEQKGIRKGLNDVLVEELHLYRKHNYKYLIAQGLPPENGQNASISFTFDIQSLKNFRPKESADGTVDFKNLNIIHNVKKGELLATKTMATDGVDGFNVLDQVIKAKKGKDARLPKGKNTEIAEDGLSLIATVDGKLEYDGHNISVNTVYTLNGDVNSATGNIDFLGSVVINGSINSGFVVKAEGSIEVSGPVEDAQIIAGGDIFLRYGIQGSEQSKLISGGNIIAKFIQNAYVEAKKDIVTEAILHAHVSAGNSIKVETGKGTIVGGQVAATNMIYAKSIGSPMGTVTSVQIGILPNLHKKHKEIEEVLKSKKESLNKVEQGIKFLFTKSRGTGLDAQKQMMLEQLNASRTPLIQEIEEIKREYDELTDLLREAQDGIIKVIDVMHPGVKLTIGNSVRYVDDTTGQAVIRKVDGEIHIGL